MKKQVLFILVYVIFALLIGIFIFGDSGIVYNIHQERELIRLSEQVVKSRAEVEEMTLEYEKLFAMKAPTYAFLMEQGRKTKNIYVFTTKDKSNKISNAEIFLNEEKRVLIYSAIAAVIILLFGYFGIWYTFKKYNTRNKESMNDLL